MGNMQICVQMHVCVAGQMAGHLSVLHEKNCSTGLYWLTFQSNSLILILIPVFSLEVVSFFFFFHESAVYSVGTLTHVILPIFTL